MRALAVGDLFFIISKMNKTSCFKSGHFINIYIIKRTLHGPLGIRILSSRAESVFNKVYESSASTFAINDQLKGPRWKRRSG